ncbi:MAG: phosphoglucosamine mutase [Ignavibacteriaceae bacterium]|jgi:phosphomannomutase|nr:phosphoglucosamine mutase [Ignavibacteriaceae bacterium]
MSTLMVSVSGIRGIVGDGLYPETLVKYTSAYSDFCGKGKIILGRDSRISGDMVKNMVIGTLQAKGNDVIDIGICPTPSVLFNVKKYKAAGGIMLSASHNPNQWNALKLLNRLGEFMTPDENKKMIEIYNNGTGDYKEWNKLGKVQVDNNAIYEHINAVLAFPFLDIKKMKRRKFRVLLDCVNGAGGWVMPELLKRLGCEVIELNCEKTGIFPRLPEPIPQNLTKTFAAVRKAKADIGIVVDPDVDRLVLITEKGIPFVEEYTIAQAVKYILNIKKGNVVVNLSTTRAVNDIASGYNCETFLSPVGEANVVKKMKEVKAVIGGEGSGGVIYPKAVFGRDALTGTIITLQHLLEFGKPMSALKSSMPQYFIQKDKIETGGNNPDLVIDKLIDKYGSSDSSGKINTEDGLRVDFDDHWVHFRKSNTEPIIRCIVEAKTELNAKQYLNKYFEQIKKM